MVALFVVVVVSLVLWSQRLTELGLFRHWRFILLLFTKRKRPADLATVIALVVALVVRYVLLLLFLIVGSVSGFDSFRRLLLCRGVLGMYRQWLRG